MHKDLTNFSNNVLLRWAVPQNYQKAYSQLGQTQVIFGISGHMDINTKLYTIVIVLFTNTSAIR